MVSFPSYLCSASRWKLRRCVVFCKFKAWSHLQQIGRPSDFDNVLLCFHLCCMLACQTWVSKWKVWGCAFHSTSTHRVALCADAIDLRQVSLLYNLGAAKWSICFPWCPTRGQVHSFVLIALYFLVLSRPLCFSIVHVDRLHCFSSFLHFTYRIV